MLKTSHFFWIGFAIVILTFAMLFFIYVNRASDRTGEILLKSVFVPVGVAFIILIWEFAQPLPNKLETVIVFAPNDHKTILFLNNALPEKLHVRFPVFDHCSNLLWPDDSIWAKYVKKYDNSEDTKGYEVTSVYYDLKARSRIELAFLTWFAERYVNHWEVENQSFDALGDLYDQRNAAAKNAEKFPLQVELKKLLHNAESSNLLLEFLKSHPFSKNQHQYFFVPSNSKVQFVTPAGQGKNSLLIKTRRSELSISIERVSGANNAQGMNKFAHEFISLFPEMKNMQHDYFQFTFDFRIDRWTRYSPQTIKEKKWFDDLVIAFKKDFSLEAFKEVVIH